MLAIRVGASWNSGNPTGGKWLHGLAPFGDLEFSTILNRCTDNSGGGGVLTVGWSMALPSNLPLPAQIRQDRLVELFAGPHLLGMAVIAETPRGTTVTADGLYRLGEQFKAVDATGLPTTDVAVAVAQAITRGLRWRDPGSLPTGAVSAMSEDSVQFNTVSALLNRYCQISGMWWYIDAQGFLRIVSTSASGRTWALSPSVPNPETADESFASRWFVRRVDGVNTDGQPNAWDANDAQDTTAPMVREEAMDLEQLGYIDAAAGDAAATALLNASKSRSGFTEGVSVTHGQITTRGGTPPELWAVSFGDTVQQPNWITASGAAASFGQNAEWVVGGTRWKQGEPLQITPIGLVPRTVASIIQSASGKQELVFK